MSSESPDRRGAAHPGSFGPVKPQERIALLDVLRGFAILGIVFVNFDIAGYYTPVVFPAAIDRLGHSLIDVLGSGKLWPPFPLPSP